MKILIMGLGHLARFIIQENKTHSISGTYRSIEKVKDIDCEKILFNTNNEGHFSLLPTNVDVVIWNFPPVQGYEKSLTTLNKHFNAKTKWIFISSTSVYGSGNINELSIRNGVRRNSKYLIDLEDQLRTFNRDVTIIRPGGLIDEKRNPAYSLSKKTEVLKANLAVNVIHTRDVARFIYHVIDHSLWDEEYNLVCDCHDSKEVFYSDQMKKLGLNVPKWISCEEESRIISNDKVKLSGFSFRETFLCSKNLF